MRIVDVHTHMPGTALSAIRGYEPQRFLDLMDAHGIAQAWVFTLDGLFFDPVPHNDRLQAFCAGDPQRLIPFCTVQPRAPGAVDELRRCVLQLGMRGVKLHPWVQSFSPTEPFMDALGEEMAELGLPVVFHDGTPPYSSPLQIAYFAQRHPRVPVLLGHAGLHDLWKEAIYAAERCPNIYLVPCGMPPHGLKQAWERLPAERFLFGSDAGFGDPYWQPFVMSKIRELPLSPDEEILVFGANADRILGGRS